MAEGAYRDKRRATRRIHDRARPATSASRSSTSPQTQTSTRRPSTKWRPAPGSKAGHSICLIGDSGTGKSHLLIGLGTAATESAHRVRYRLAAKLVNELVEAADDKQLSKTIARYGRVG
jgi:DNA replication protein DnaC